MQTKIKLLMLLTLLASTNLHAQNKNLSTDSLPKPSSHRAVYAELLGNGILFSVNYDFRFNKTDKGLGMRLGFGFFGVTDLGLISFPVGINYLAGKAPNYLETGIGYTYAIGTGFFGDSHASIIVPSIGYRYQSFKKGFFGRVVISPLISLTDHGEGMFWAGIGIGHTF